MGPLDRIALLADEAAIEPPATLVVGDVVAAELVLAYATRSPAASHA
jgi:siroheme synthase